MASALDYDVDLIRADAAARGWVATDLARAAKLSDQTVSQFFQKKNRSARTLAKLANALGRKPSRYILPSRSSSRRVA